ncbi:MAG: oxidoreductase, partial [Magnetospirillum sp.]
MIRSGQIVVEEVPAPVAGLKEILVAVTHSCVSVGTEGTSLAMSGTPLYRRAIKQPHHVKRVLEIIRDQGLGTAVRRIRSQLEAGSPTGYSAAGIVIAMGEAVDGFAIGDRVACAGAGIANHAEIIAVPVNLAVRIPIGLDEAAASTVT